MMILAFPRILAGIGAPKEAARAVENHARETQVAVERV